ncbi:MAG: LacI family DNA-binding transcriptional regulator [Anaerolineae bacterium]|nr:LacI family DNA-binding transcriptional regulator [Anaerolineae bacterium]
MPDNRLTSCPLSRYDNVTVTQHLPWGNVLQKKRITMADVARAARVSKMSVSRVLNNKPGVSEETRQRVLMAVKQLHYVPSPPLHTRASRTRMLALLVPGITTAYMAEILRGVCGTAERLNYGLILYTQRLVDDTERTEYYLSLLKNALVDGVVMVVPRDYEIIVADLKTRGLPYVIVDHRGMGDGPSVTATNRKGIQDATRYLLALGHRRIGFITGRMDVACSHDRLEGYRNGLAEVGLLFDPELVRKGNYQQVSGFEQGRCLLELPDPPTAIIASNDLMAFGVMDAAKAAGLKVGEDISIVGFDDIDMASQTHPPLTTVRQPLAEMGEMALEMLASLIQGQSLLKRQRELPTELIIRGTTGRAPMG